MEEGPSPVASKLATLRQHGAKILLCGMLLGFGVCMAYRGDPKPCEAVVECSAIKNSMETEQDQPQSVGVGAAALILGVLIQEIFSFVSQESQESEDVCSTFLNRKRSSAAACTILVLLLCVQIIFTICRSMAEVMAMSPVDGFAKNYQPVFLIRYVDWCIRSGLLLALVGRTALNRPWAEVLIQIFMIGVCILLCWAACLSSSVSDRWMVLTVAALIFSCTMREMFHWFVDFRQCAPATVPGKSWRAKLPFFLVALFTAYCTTWSLAFFGAVSTITEQTLYAFCNLVCTAGVCISISYLRRIEDHHFIQSCRKQADTTKMTTYAILRSNYDIVFDCEIDSQGVCRLPNSRAPNMQELEYRLKRSMANNKMNNIVRNEKDFTKYVKRVRRCQYFQSKNSQGISKLIKEKGDAFYLDKNILPVTPGINCEIICRPFDTQMLTSIQLSIFPTEKGSVQSSKDACHAMMGLRITSTDTFTPGPEESGSGASPPQKISFLGPPGGKASNASEKRRKSQEPVQAQKKADPSFEKLDMAIQKLQEKAMQDAAAKQSKSSRRSSDPSVADMEAEAPQTRGEIDGQSADESLDSIGCVKVLRDLPGDAGGPKVPRPRRSEPARTQKFKGSSRKADTAELSSHNVAARTSLFPKMPLKPFASAPMNDSRNSSSPTPAFQKDTEPSDVGNRSGTIGEGRPLFLTAPTGRPSFDGPKRPARAPSDWRTHGSETSVDTVGMPKPYRTALPDWQPENPLASSAWQPENPLAPPARQPDSPSTSMDMQGKPKELGPGRQPENIRRSGSHPTFDTENPTSTSVDTQNGTKESKPPLMPDFQLTGDLEKGETERIDAMSTRKKGTSSHSGSAPQTKWEDLNTPLLRDFQDTSDANDTV